MSLSEHPKKRRNLLRWKTNRLRRLKCNRIQRTLLQQERMVQLERTITEAHLAITGKALKRIKGNSK